jgi:hypothetical protein
MENRKKISAAAAAVLSYIMTEEEAVFIQSLTAPSVQKGPDPFAAAAAFVKMWGVSGRLAQMQMRNMMQMKTFK